MIEKIDTHQGLPRCIRRESLYDDVVQMYQVHLKEILKECRELFFTFWEKVYIKYFDSDKLLIPAVHGTE